ncbi:NADPH:quinone reductase [Polynucleobacter kasalickyi]|uniref:NADPH:quinone reductase n=1 Tax=Polynucleobacter kasalickyi TaxID=1938817 RepID=A0A1W1YKA0_9BURK|nr:NADPH:quinone reductase [Polynucleobacter kasalickyi]SMC36617.1 NADPH:quinone reductase [Polynucleobacter kasalickyi]
MMMRAATYHQFGKAEDVLRIEHLAIPKAGPNQVVVKMFACGMNPSDTKLRSGTSRQLTDSWQIPSSDGAGIVHELGSGVPSFHVGQRVWVFNAAFLRPNGTAAEYCLVEDWMVVPLPDTLSFQEGACLGIPVMTAHRCLFSDGELQGKTVLVAGGAGVVAHYAIQLAKWGGATVITTVSSDEKAHHATLAGADYVINYKKENVAYRVDEITGHQGVDRIVEVDFGANLHLNAQILKPGGVSVMYAYVAAPNMPLPIPALMSKNITLKFTLIYTITPEQRRQILSDIKVWIAAKKPIFAIAHEYPLEEVVQSHLAIEGGQKIGHIILNI